MVNTGFMRRRNLDATADVICLCCFRTITRGQTRTELAAAENEHLCNPFDDLVSLYPNSFQGLCDRGEIAASSEVGRAD